VTEPDKKANELGHWWPQILPDGDTVIFTSVGTPIETSRIMARSLKTGEQKLVIRGAVGGRATDSGHLLFARVETVLAAPFDAARAEVTGPAVPIAGGVPSGTRSCERGLLYALVDPPRAGQAGSALLKARAGASHEIGRHEAQAPPRPVGPRTSLGAWRRDPIRLPYSLHVVQDALPRVRSFGQVRAVEFGRRRYRPRAPSQNYGTLSRYPVHVTWPPERPQDELA
jgi:hypothetical protein